MLLTGTEKTLLRYCEQVRKLKQSAVSDSGCVRGHGQKLEGYLPQAARESERKASQNEKYSVISLFKLVG